MQYFGGSASEQLVNTVRTLSDTKRSFYTRHQRPVDSLYRRVVEELMVEMHLLSVNAEFRYDPFYALGVVTTYDRFMAGYQPEAERASIFQAICTAVEEDPARYRQDSDALLTAIGQLSPETAVEWLAGGPQPEGIPDSLHQSLQGIASRERFKYSRLFAIGLYAALERANPTLIAEEESRTEALEKICNDLKLPTEKLIKDLTLYRENLEKLAQARQVLEDAIAASRKQRERREAEKKAAAAAGNAAADATLAGSTTAGGTETGPAPTEPEAAEEDSSKDGGPSS